LTAGVAYLSEYVDRSYSIAYFLPVILAVVLYIFHGNIDFWYLKKHPAGLDRALNEWLKNNFVPFQHLDFKSKEKFKYRLELYLNARLFTARGSEDKEVPEDIKSLIAGYGIFLGLRQADFLLGDFDRVILYGHPFPTPLQNSLHSVEVNEEDGVIIINTALLLQAFTNPWHYYNVAVHAYISVFESIYGNLPEILHLEFPEKVVAWTVEDICNQIGLEEVLPGYVHVHHYVVFPNEYRLAYPALAIEIDRYLTRD